MNKHRAPGVLRRIGVGDVAFDVLSLRLGQESEGDEKLGHVFHGVDRPLVRNLMGYRAMRVIATSTVSIVDKIRTGAIRSCPLSQTKYETLSSVVESGTPAFRNSALNA